MRGNVMARAAVTTIACLLLLVMIQDTGGVEAWQRGRALVVERSLVMSLQPFKREGGCNTDPNICDASKHQKCCRGRCHNVHSNDFHCGHCYNSCQQGHSCCSTSCADLNSDPANCGTCGNSCMTGLACKNGLCGYSD